MKVLIVSGAFYNAHYLSKIGNLLEEKLREKIKDVEIDLFNGGEESEVGSLSLTKSKYDIVFYLPSINLNFDHLSLFNNFRRNNKDVIIISGDSILDRSYIEQKEEAYIKSGKTEYFISLDEDNAGSIYFKLKDKYENILCNTMDINDFFEVLLKAIKIHKNSLYDYPLEDKSSAAIIPNERYFFNQINNQRYGIFKDITENFNSKNGRIPYEWLNTSYSFKNDYDIYISESFKPYLDNSDFLKIKKIENNILYNKGESNLSIGRKGNFHFDLMNSFPEAKFIIETGNYYLENTPYTEVKSSPELKNCVNEVIKTVRKYYNSLSDDFISINIRGYGSLVMTNDTEKFDSLVFTPKKEEEYFNLWEELYQ